MDKIKIMYERKTWEEGGRWVHGIGDAMLQFNQSLMRHHH
jgi:hypothetical protein